MFVFLANKIDITNISYKEMFIVSRVLLLVILLSTPVLAERVEVFFNVPAGLEAYTGKQAVTFGVPFEKGVLRKSDPVRLVDESGAPLPAQFEVTSVYCPESPDVRWLLVDAFADVRAGKASRAFLEFGADVKSSVSPGRLEFQSGAGDFRMPTGAATFDSAQLRKFVLTDGEGKVFRPEPGTAEIERTGPVRAVVKFQGKYRAEDGSSIADYVTRIRVYAGCSYARIYHTLIWTVDEKTQIGGLHYALSFPGGQVQAGLDGHAVDLPPDGTIFQADWNVARGAASGTHLDGWLAAPAGGGVFTGLRWAWQQFPTSVGATSSELVLGLIGPEKPLSLLPMDAAVDAVKRVGNVLENGGMDAWDTNANVPYRPGGKDHKEGWISPRGVAKTYEILVWLGDKDVSPEIKNILLQHPVFAYADPQFAVRASLPSPASACDPVKFPDVEGALKRAFDWTTVERARDFDFGVWNYGDIQWAWVELGGYTTYRYWMNNGKGWSVVPWALWLRSGDRDYYEKAEANSRHVMDIDTCHVDDWAKEGKPRDGKIKGGMYHYCALHWAYGPRILPFYSDSEYLPNYYFMTGYERAKDVMTERVEGIKNSPESVDYMLNLFQESTKHSRHLYAPTKDMLVLYEATWDPVLGKHAESLTDLVLNGQREDGGFFGVKSNHYLDQTLNIGRRVLDSERSEKLKNAIANWTVFTGNNETGGPSIDIENGWLSLWSQVVTAGVLKDERFVRRAARIMASQAAVVDDSETEWRGINPIFIHEIGPALRDWPIVMKAVNESGEPISEDPALRYEPMTYISGALKASAEDQAAGWKYREAALVLKESEDPLKLQIYMWGGGQGEMACLVRITGPDGRQVQLDDKSVSFSGLYGAVQVASGPIAVELPKGPPGVYAVEVLMKDRRPSIHVQSAAGKIVYPVVQGQGNAFFTPVYIGQMWFEPNGSGPVTFGFAGNHINGRMSVFGPDGKRVAFEQAQGTRVIKALDDGIRPEGEPLRFTPAEKGLYSVLIPVPRDKNCTVYVSGCRPWFSARKEAWFDPEKYPAPDLQALLK